MVTSADMHRIEARHLRRVAVALGAFGVLALGASIALAALGTNAALVLVADGIGLCLGWSAAFPWHRAREESRHAKTLDDEDDVRDTRAEWAERWSAAGFDKCQCVLCKRETSAS